LGAIDRDTSRRAAGPKSLRFSIPWRRQRQLQQVASCIAPGHRFDRPEPASVIGGRQGLALKKAGRKPPLRRQWPKGHA